MPITEEAIQQTVLSFEAGTMAKVVRRAAFTVAILLLCWFYLVHEFRGLSMSQGMDQAQIGREILRGHGFATQVARPLAMGELRRNGKDVKTAIWVDTYNAPLPPLLDAAALYLPVKWGAQMTRKDLVYVGDRAIAILQVVCFLASIGVLYLLAVELFDQRLAYMACALVLVCNMMWDYALSGLPQMWLLLLFNCTFYALVRAMQATEAGQPASLPFRWLAAAGAGFGLLALSHAITIWLFVPALVFCGFYFRPRIWGGVLMLAIFLAIYSPWLVRNAAVCGDARGLAIYSGLDGIQHSEMGHMRRPEIDLKDVTGSYYLENARTNLVSQVNRLIEFFGWSCVAPLAFVSLLHPFKRPVTAAARWLAMFMWAGAVMGMSVFGLKQYHELAANQLHLLFVPIFICYGMAYLLVQWDRRIGIAGSGEQPGTAPRLLRRSIVALVFFLSGLPMLGRMFFTKTQWQVQWPPYLPPYISVIRDWTQPNEIVASDMPWAVAWYADRRSLWLPYSPQALFQINDYRELGDPVPAIYLTPISGTENTLGDLVNGEYQKWTAYIVRTIDPKTTPYPWKSVLGMADCVFYADRDRHPNPPPEK